MIQYFDIDDQFNQANIEAAKKEKAQWDKWDKKHPCSWKAMCELPEEDEVAIEIKR